MSAEAVAAAELKDEIKAVLKTERGGVRIPEAVAELLAKLFIESQLIGEAEQVKALGADVLRAAFEDAGGTSGLILTVLKKWADAAESATKAPKAPTLKKVVKKPVLAESCDELSDEDEDAASVVGDRTDKSKKDKLAERDTLVTGMTRAQALAFAASLYAGFVVAEEVVEGWAYGTDVALTEWARKLRKNDHPTLKSILDKKDAEELNEHWVNLMRAFNEEGMTLETTVLTSFMTMTGQLFQDDNPGKIKYVKEILAKYKGRGLPFRHGYDLALVVKLQKIGGSSAQVATLQKEVSSLKEQLGTVKGLAKEARDLASALQGRVTKLESKPKGGPPSGGGDGDTPPCGYCKQQGHFARNCPVKKEDERKAAEEAANGSGS